MKKLLNKILVLALALTVALATVGCGGDKGGDSAGSSDGKPSTSTVQPLEPSISMSSSLSLILGETKGAGVVTKNIKGDVNYTSENPAVAEFKNGNIVAVGEGSTIVTASFGTATASCAVTVSYGNYRPSLELNSNLSNSTTIGYNKTYNILPYVSFNKSVYDDATFEYEVEDDSIISVSKDGVITGLKTGSTELTINTNWRDFTSKEGVDTLTQTDTLGAKFTITVRDNVAFYNDGDVLSTAVINTPASFQTEYANIHKINPTVVINDAAPVALSAENVSISSVASAISGDDYYDWDANTLTITAKKMGSVIVEYSYVYGGTTYSDNYVVNFDRPVKAIEETAEFFSAKKGLFKVKSGSGYEDKTLSSYAWGEEVALVDAYQDGNSLEITADGKILGVQVNHDSTVDTTIVLGTATEVYEIPVNAAMYFISEPEELKHALQRIDDPIVETGYHVLLNDIDMTGVVIDNRIHGYNAPNYTYYDESGNMVVSKAKDISFDGVFDGNGYVIYNAVTELPTTYKTLYESYDHATGTPGAKKSVSFQAYGLFHILTSTAVVKNVAFVNLKGTGTTTQAYGLVAPLTWSLRGTVENCYINISKDNPTTRGPFATLEASASIKNCVIDFPMHDDYKFVEEIEIITGRDLNAWGYGSVGHNVGATLNYPANYSNNYVISQAPIYFGTAGNTGVLDDDTAGGAIYYGENETQLLYPYKIFDTVHGKDVVHTVQSTEGARLVEFDIVKKTGKTRIVQNFQRYDSYADLADSTYAGVDTYNTFYQYNDNWVVTGNVPIWHSLTDFHNENFYATINDSEELEINCYDSQVFDVKLYGGSVDNLVLTENSDLIAVDGCVVKGLKIGTGATITANFTFNGKAYSRTYTVDVLDPFYFNNGAEDFLTETEVLEGEKLTLDVMIAGVKVENVTWTSNSANATIVGNELTGVKYLKNITVTANFTYEGVDYTKAFTLEVLDPYVAASTITIGGVVYEGEAISAVIGEDGLDLEIVCGEYTISDIIVTDDKNLYKYENGKLVADLYGETTLVISFVADGQVHYADVLAVAERQVQVIDTAVDFDANVGGILSTVIDNSGIVNATVTYGEEKPFVLTTENGGIVDGKIRVKSNKNDEVAGFPYINTKEFAASPVLNVEIGTNKKVYQFTNVTFWTSIIDDANELKAALDFDYTKSTTHNYGFYKLAANIDMTGVTFAYSGYTDKVKNQNSEFGFAGQFDGCGYTIANATGLTYGLFGNFVHGGGTRPVSNVKVENVAITNFLYTAGDQNTYGKGAVLGKYTNTHNYWPNAQLVVNNVYVSFATNSLTNGIIAYVAYANISNVVIDTIGNTVAPGATLAGAEYGADVAGKAIEFNHNQYTDGAALFPNTRFLTPTTASTDYINNVITLGATPVVYSWGYGVGYGELWKRDGDAWVKKNSGTLQPYTTVETYYGYAANQVKGDIPMMTGMKEGFATIVADKTSTAAIVGYVCTTCGEVFSLTEGTCSTCEVALTKFANLWNTPWSYTWKLLDIASHENTLENATYKSGTYVFAGVSKYNTVDEMKAAYTANNEAFASFTGEAGNGMWSVVEGKLVWVGTAA